MLGILAKGSKAIRTEFDRLTPLNCFTSTTAGGGLARVRLKAPHTPRHQQQQLQRTASPPRSITRTMVSSLLLLRSVRASSNGGSTLQTLLQPQLRQQGPAAALAMAGGVRRSMATTLTQRPPRLPGRLLGGRQGRLRSFSTSGSGGGGGSGAGRAQSKASIPVAPSIDCFTSHRSLLTIPNTDTHTDTTKARARRRRRRWRSGTSGWACTSSASWWR